MSIRAMNHVWDHSKASGSALVVLLAIADAANDEDWSSWISVPRLSEKTRLSERQLQRILRALEAAGELIVEEGAGKKTPRGATNLYTIPQGVTSTSPGDIHDTGGVTPMSPVGVTPMSPRSISSDPSVKDSLGGVGNARAEVFEAFNNNIHLLTPIAADRLKDWLADVPSDWVLKAIQEAVRHNARSLAYVEGILKCWQKEGLPSSKPAAVEPAAAATPAPLDEERVARYLQLQPADPPEAYLPGKPQDERRKYWGMVGRRAFAIRAMKASLAS